MIDAGHLALQESPPVRVPAGIYRKVVCPTIVIIGHTTGSPNRAQQLPALLYGYPDKGKLTSCHHRAHLALHPAKPRESRCFWRDSAGAFGCRSVVSHDRVAGAFRSTARPR